MRLLDRYLLRELAVPLAYCVAGFFIFWLSFDLFSNLEKFQKAQLSFGEILVYYLVTAPEEMLMILPVSLLLALLYSLTNHARHNELTAMRAAGISLWRLSAPYFATGLAFTAAYFAVNEYWAPRARDKGEEILSRHEEGNAGGTNRFWQSNLIFSNQREGRTWSIRRYQTRTHEMEKPDIYCQEPGGERRDIHADRGIYTNGTWLLQGNVQVFDFESTKFGTNELYKKYETNEISLAGFSETPQLIQSEIRVRSITTIRAGKRAQLSLREISDYQLLHNDLDATRTAFIQTQWHGRLAEPWTCLVVVLIALPFGAASGRRNVFVGVASSIFICFAYFILLRLCLNLGIGGKLPAWLAGWLPDLAFGSAGLFMVGRVR